EEIEGAARLNELWPDLRAAVAWACARGEFARAAALVRPVATELTLRARQEIGDFAERILAITPVPETAVRAFWLVWVAERSIQSGDPGAYERVVARHGEPDHALARYARAYANGDGEGLARCLPDAVAALEASGDDQLARFIELASAGS